MVRSGEKLAVLLLSLLGILQTVSAFGAAQGYRSSPFIRYRHSPGPAFERPASTMRSLLDSETAPTDGKTHHMSEKWLLVIVLTVSAIALAIVLLLCSLRRCAAARKRRNVSKSTMHVWDNQLSTVQHPEFSTSGNTSSCTGSSRLDASKVAPWTSRMRGSAGTKRTAACVSAVPHALLRAATKDFSASNLLGEGSFGLVYKAQLENGVTAAVKRLSAAVSKHSQKEFQGEVALMSKIRHPNLVALLGYSSDGPEPLVVYELMRNGSLHDQLHGPSLGAALPWRLRLKIALEAARGLEYLHGICKPPIIHRDFKASNILLDASFNAKVSDFGLAVALEEGGLLKDDVQVQGTFGYIAPEYLMDGTLTEKSDVYGFGVVLLELLTGRLPIDTSLPLGSQSLVTWVTPWLTNRTKLIEIIDPSLKDSVNMKHLHQVAAVAALCVQAEPSYRPLIVDVVQSLLPLVPQELGGALRGDPNCKPNSCSETENSSQRLVPVVEGPRDSGFIEVDLHKSFHSHRSDYSLGSIDQFPKSPSLSSLARSDSWEDATKSHLEQQQS